MTDIVNVAFVPAQHSCIEMRSQFTTILAVLNSCAGLCISLLVAAGQVG